MWRFRSVEVLKYHAYNDCKIRGSVHFTLYRRSLAIRWSAAVKFSWVDEDSVGRSQGFNSYGGSYLRRNMDTKFG